MTPTKKDIEIALRQLKKEFETAGFVVNVNTDKLPSAHIPESRKQNKHMNKTHVLRLRVEITDDHLIAVAHSHGQKKVTIRDAKSDLYALIMGHYELIISDYENDLQKEKETKSSI